MALVQWTESIGLTLVKRDLSSMTLRTPVTGATVQYDILQTFPFTSETKRMGIIVRVSTVDHKPPGPQIVISCYRFLKVLLY